MSPNQQQLSLLGRLLANFVLAALVYAAAHLLPLTSITFAIALMVLALGSALIASISVASPTVGGGVKAKRVTGSTGKIKWFNATKGFGFIVGDDGAEVFVHYRNVEGLSKRSIKEGQQVSYVVKQSDRGPQAEEVKPL